MRLLLLLAGLIGALLPAPGATLEKLSLDQMIEKSTEIARVRIDASRAERRGPLIYTFFNAKVLEQWKGAPRQTIEVAVPGGSAGGYRQDFSGAPALKRGAEYVLFLWRSKSGINHVIGLSQGVFTLSVDEKGQVTVRRAASGEVMLDPQTGQPVRDTAISIGIDELRDHVERTLGVAKK